MRIFRWEINLVDRRYFKGLEEGIKRRFQETEEKRKKRIREDRKQGLRKCLGHYPIIPKEQAVRDGIYYKNFDRLDKYGQCQKCKGWDNNLCPTCKIGNIGTELHGKILTAQCNYCDYKKQIKR